MEETYIGTQYNARSAGWGQPMSGGTYDASSCIL